MKVPNGLAQTAYHEAGHAVACCLVRVRLGSATIIPDPESNSLGRCTRTLWKGFHPDAEADRRTVERTKKQMFVLCAAVYSERRAAREKGQPDWKREPHLQETLQYSSCLFGSYDAAVAYADCMWLQARDWMRFHWRAVDGVAKALLQAKTISSRRVRELVARRSGGTAMPTVDLV